MTVYKNENGANERGETVSKLYVVHAADGSTVVFDPESPRYKCCCRQMHVRTAAILIGVLESVATLIGLIVVTANYYKLGQNYSTPFAVGVVFVVLYVSMLSLFFCALCAQNATFLVGHLLLQLVTMALFVAIIVIITVQLVRDDTVALRYWAGQGPEQSIDVAWSYLTVAVALVTVCSLSTLLYAWFIVEVFRCYRYFLDRKKFRNYVVATQVVRVPFKEVKETRLPQHDHDETIDTKV